jgi:hypothetical protein
MRLVFFPLRDLALTYRPFCLVKLCIFSDTALALLFEIYQVNKVFKS